MSLENIPKIWPTVVHMLAHAAEKAPEQLALVCNDEKLNYREYVSCVSGLAKELQGFGIAKGDRIAVLMANSVDIAIASFAVQAAGAQLVPLNPAYTTFELNQVLSNAKARGIIYDEAVASTVSGISNKFEFSICVGEEKPQSQRLTRWRQESDLVSQLPLPEPESMSTLQYTGGTTGVPKGAQLTHKSVSTNVSQREAMLPTEAGKERILAITPLFHVYAVSMGLYMSAYCYGTLYILPTYRRELTLQAIEQHKITVLLGSPTIFTGLLEFEGLDKIDFSALKWSSSGSSALSEETLRRWQETTGGVICEGYGQTEAGPLLTQNPLHGARKVGTVGYSLPGTEIKIFNTEGDGQQTVGTGEIGEVCARGPQIMQGYESMPEETSATLRNGWLHTGDLGKLDEEGYLTICGRKKEMVIVSGFNVYPREVEEALHCHPDVLEAAVLGIPDSYRGEVLVAYVTISKQIDEQSLKDFLAERLIKYKQPTYIKIIDNLPKTPVGKIDKKSLANRADLSA